MGKDYAARRKGIGALHVSASADIELRQILEQLDVPTGEWSPFNDGKPIRAATCRLWGQALREAGPRLWWAYYKSSPRKRRADYRFPYVAVSAGRAPVNPPEAVSAAMARLVAAEREADGTELTFAHVERVDGPFLGWLRTASRFFARSGGCVQD